MQRRNTKNGLIVEFIGIGKPHKFIMCVSLPVKPHHNLNLSWRKDTIKCQMGYISFVLFFIWRSNKFLCFLRSEFLRKAGWRAVGVVISATTTFNVADATNAQSFKINNLTNGTAFAFCFLCGPGLLGDEDDDRSDR